MLESSVIRTDTAVYKQAEEVTNALSRSIDNEKKQRERIKQIADDHKSDKVFALLANVCERMLTVQSAAHRIALARQLAALYPSSGTDISVSTQLTNRAAKLGFELPQGSPFSVQQAREQLRAAVLLRSEYSPAALEDILLPFTQFTEMAAPLGLGNVKVAKDAPETADILGGKALATDPAFGRLSRAMELYARGFVRYWGNFPETLLPRLASWSQLRDFATTGGAYQINSLLLSAYELASELISSVSDPVLGKAGAAEKMQFLNALEARRKALTLTYSDQCAQALTFLGSWPASAIDASRQSRTLYTDRDKQKLLGIAGTVPWWDQFVKLASELLDNDALYDGARILREAQPAMKRFPLQRGGSVEQAITSTEEFLRIERLLGNLGLGDPAASDGKAPQSALCRSLPNCDQLQQWARRVRSVALTLSDVVPLRWSLKLPDAQKRAELEDKMRRHSNPLPDAAIRFRYLQLSADGYRTALYSSATSAKSAKTVLTGAADATDITLGFYRYADTSATKPDAEIRVSGSWAALQLYLRGDGIEDADKKTIWVPLAITSASGEQSRFYVGISFDQALPLPSQWPDAAHWPQF